MAPEKLDEKHLPNSDNGERKTGNTIETVEMSRDEYTLATLGYRQVFVRSFGLFENVSMVLPWRRKRRMTDDGTQWAATFTTMNFVSGMPVLFGFAMYVCLARHVRSGDLLITYGSLKDHRWTSSRTSIGPIGRQWYTSALSILTVQQAFSNWTMVGGLSLIVSFSMAEIAAALPTTGGIYLWSYRLGGERHGKFLSWLTAWYNWAGECCLWLLKRPFTDASDFQDGSRSCPASHKVPPTFCRALCRSYILTRRSLPLDGSVGACLPLRS
jgi:hypothetical protein